MPPAAITSISRSPVTRSAGRLWARSRQNESHASLVAGIDSRETSSPPFSSLVLSESRSILALRNYYFFSTRNGALRNNFVRQRCLCAFGARAARYRPGVLAASAKAPVARLEMFILGGYRGIRMSAFGQKRTFATASSHP